MMTMDTEDDEPVNKRVRTQDAEIEECKETQTDIELLTSANDEDGSTFFEMQVTWNNVNLN